MATRNRFAVSTSADSSQSNPFAEPINPFEVQDPFAPSEAQSTYVLARRGPALNADEYELADQASLEVAVLWGTTVLAVKHLTPPRSFYVGEEENKHLHCDVFLPQEKLGTPRMPLILVDSDSQARLVIPAGASGTVTQSGKPPVKLEELRAQGSLNACPELSGAQELKLSQGMQARLQMGDLAFLVSAVRAGRRVAASGLVHRDWNAAIYVGLSLLAHASLITAMALFMPPLGLSEDTSITGEDQLYLLQQYLQASAERQVEATQEDQGPAEKTDSHGGGTGTQAAGSEGQMGSPTAKASKGHYGVQGPAENPDPHIARDRDLQMARTFGMIGVLNAGGGGDPNAPTAPWGREDSLGRDPISAIGPMWGDSIAEGHGAGGLGLSGIGEGGGGVGEGIGLGYINTIGRGAGTGTDQGFGNSAGRFQKGHQPKSPRVAMGVTEVAGGRLPPEIIQRIVRQNYGRFRLCYENGLRSNPTLQGRVSVRFIIGRDGGVSQVSTGGSDLPDPSVVQCVAKAYYGLSFPSPEGGLVSVVYPIMFTPGS